MTEERDDTSVTLTYLRRHFHRLFRDIESGKTRMITRRGRPVARLMPVEDPGSPVRKQAEPTIPLFASGISDLGTRGDELLEGFGGH